MTDYEWLKVILADVYESGRTEGGGREDSFTVPLRNRTIEVKLMELLDFIEKRGIFVKEGILECGGLVAGQTAPYLSEGGRS